MAQIMVVAGTDSSGGAGLTRDTATAQSLGLGVKPVVTAVTTQTNARLHDIHIVPTETIASQMVSGLSDTPPDAVKIGLLGNAQTCAAVAQVLSRYGQPTVCDPVLKSSSGGALMAKEGLAPIFAQIDLLTPNLEEAAQLTQTPKAIIATDIARQAGILRQRYGFAAVLIKGGHGSGEVCTDHLFDDAGCIAFSHPRLPKGKRGTGCTLSTAIACYLAQGHPLRAACDQAIKYVHRWLHAPSVTIR